MINFKKKLRTVVEIGHRIFIQTSQSRAQGRTLPAHVHTTDVFKINILTGHEETDKLRFILKTFCILYLSKNHAFSQNVYS